MLGQGRFAKIQMAVLVVIALVMGANLISPAVAHVTRKLNHLYKHLDPRYINVGEKATSAATADTATNATNATNAGNADKVDNLDANGITRLARGQQAANIVLTGVFQTIASVNITLPAPGFVLVDGSANIETFTEACNCIAELQLRDTGAGGTSSPAFFTTTGNDVGTDDDANRSWVFQVAAAGARTFVLEARRFNIPTGTSQLAFASTITALYGPFGSTGGATLRPTGSEAPRSSKSAAPSGA
jgi:hypothetical protein